MSGSAVNISVNLVGRNLLGGSLSTVATGLSQLSSSGSRLSGILTALNSTTGKLAIGAAGAGLLFAGFAAIIKTGVGGAEELQSKLLMLQQALQANSDAMPVLTNAVNDLGVKTVYSSSEAADAFAVLVRMGFDASQVMYGAGAAADEYSSHAYNATEATHGLGFEGLALGQALKMGATDGAILAATAVQQFGAQVRASSDPTKEASSIINDLAGAYLNGAKSGSDLLRFIQQVGPTAATMGVQFKDLVTTGDVLAQAMGSIGLAGTRLRYMLATLTHPTKAQGTEMSFLGLQTVDTGAKFNTFAGQLEKAGLVSTQQVAAWKGSQTGLNNLFDVAQQAGKIPLDQNFMQWALSTGMMSSKLYDSHGAFISTKNAVDQLMTSLKNKTPEERMQALATLFNVRGGDAGKILTSLGNFDSEYTQIWNRIGKTDVVSMAMQQLQTLSGAWQAFTDSLKSGLAVSFLGLLPGITAVINRLNDLLQYFLNAPPKVQMLVGVFLLVGAALAGLTAVVLGVLAVISLLAPLATVVAGGFGTLAAIALGVPAAILAVTAAITGLVVWFRNGAQGADGLKQHIGAIAGLLVGAASAAFLVLGGHVAQAQAFFGPFGTVLGKVFGFFRNLIPEVRAFGGFLMDAFKGGVGIIKTIWSALMGFDDVWVAFFSRMGGWSGLLGNLWQGFLRLGGQLLDVGVHLIDLFDAAGGVQGILASLWGTITAGAADLWVLVAPIAAVVGVALLIAAAVAGVIIQFQHWWATSSQFRDIVLDLWNRLQQLGTLLMGQLQQGLKAVQGAMGNMGPTLTALKGAWVALQPVLEIIGGVLIVLIIAALGILIAVLRGVIGTIGPLIVMLVGVFSGALRIVAGVFEFLAGVVQTVIGVIKGLFTGDWSGALAGLQTMKAGIINIWEGLKGVVVSLVTGLISAVVGLIGGFVGGIIDWFTHLYDVLVGHSIVPDMVNAIVQWLTGMPGRILGAIIGFVASVISAFVGLGVRALAAINLLVSLGIALFLSLGARALSAVSQMVNAICNEALALEARVLSTLAAMVNMAVSFFLSMDARGVAAVAQMASSIIGRAASMAGQFISQVSGMAAQAVSQVESMGARIVASLGGVAGQLAGVGRNMISGLVGGIRSMAGAAAQAAAGVAGNAVNAARSALGINSPSKVFHDIGAGTVEGFVNGLAANGSSVQSAYSKTFNPSSHSLSVLNAQNANALATAGSYGSQGNLTIPVYIGNDKVAQVVLDKATGKLKQSGVSRMRR